MWFIRAVAWHSIEPFEPQTASLERERSLAAMPDNLLLWAAEVTGSVPL